MSERQDRAVKLDQLLGMFARRDSTVNSPAIVADRPSRLGRESGLHRVEPPRKGHQTARRLPTFSGERHKINSGCRVKERRSGASRGGFSRFLALEAFLSELRVGTICSNRWDSPHVSKEDDQNVGIDADR